MKIRNQALIKRPWIWPVCTTIGAALIFVQGANISLTTKVEIFSGVVVVLNAFFFVVLKHTLREVRTRQNPDSN
jgi:NADH:ubiquinone oxidoreductase subunit 6 (subunit J)